MLQSLLLSLFYTFLAGVPDDVHVAFDDQAKVIVIEGVADTEDIAVFFGAFENADQPKVIGFFKKEEGRILFRAKYGFSPGSQYTIAIGSLKSDDVAPQMQVVQIPEEIKIPSTSITNVFPTAGSLPMNQLKLYIEFSAPMRMGRAYDHIKLFRLPDRILEDEAFLAMPEELWDPERKRLTIFFDPGRIKRGVQPNLQLGLPLVEGRSYELVIDENWLDINGAQLKTGFRKTFNVVAVDRESPDSRSWLLTRPSAGSREALTIDFEEHMDYGLLHSTINVTNEAGMPIEGVVNLSDQERKWHFLPAKPWRNGSYRIVINPWLEDLAGNNLRRKFDVDLEAPEDRPKDISEVVIPFKVSTQNQD